ncbi:MAG: hypothetical protein P4N41_25620 [Negativicutes bacterium]|nr:hypothetical protein [Negativicutes bacterium]
MDWLNSINWATVLASLGFSVGTVAVGFWYILKKGTDFHFTKMLETYKRNLQDINEKTKFDYQRKLMDFNLYTTKKHEHYIALYEALRKAHGTVMHLASPLRERASYDWFNETDIEKHLNELCLPKGKAEELLNNWKSNQKEAEKEIRKCVTLKEEMDSKNTIIKLSNIYWKSQLYIFPALNDEFKPYLDKINTLSINCKSEYRETMNKKDYLELCSENGVLQKEVDVIFSNILSKMREELSVGGQ